MNKTTILALTLLFATLTGFGVYQLSKQSTGSLKYHHRLNKIAQEANSLQNTWKAGDNQRWIENDEENIKRSLGVLPGTPNGIELEEVGTVANGLPESFDSRTQWGDKCTSLWEVRDQSNCGSCWAFGAVESITDRHCIKLGQDIRLSAQNMLTCCSTCGMGCNGGYPIAAMQYYVKTGLVTGDLYGNNSWCQAYSFAPCAHHVTSDVYPPCTGEFPTPKCSKSCDAGSSHVYAQDVHKGSKAYSVAKNQDAIMTEIMTNGPVEVALTVYEDFLTYKTGVYKHVTGKALGGHAVKMVGWGVENGTPYWTVVNSWNESWGDKGTFKILRGKNECGIESQVVAALPLN